LTMIPVTRDLKLALQSSREAFGKKLNAVLPDGWPQLPQAFVPHDIEPAVPWCAYVFLDNRKRLLVGSGGFLSTPDKDADVEIGYEIAPAVRSHGFATEAVEALIDVATVNRARFLFARTPAGANASSAVARKAGMEVVDDDFDKNIGLVWRFRITCDEKRIPLGNVSLRMSA